MRFNTISTHTLNQAVYIVISLLFIDGKYMCTRGQALHPAAPVQLAVEVAVWLVVCTRPYMFWCFHILEKAPVCAYRTRVTIT